MRKNSKSNANGMTPAQRFLDLIRKHIAGIRRDMSKLVEMAEEMADALLAGGNIFTPPLSKFWPSEFSGRAGGLMCLEGDAGHSEDIGFSPLPDPRKWDPHKDETLQALLKGKARLFVVGRPEDLGDLGTSKRFAGFTGGARADRGMYSFRDFQPFGSTRHFELFVRGWVTTGEMVCACIRRGKMPIIHMSVWFEGSMVRNRSFTFTDYGNCHEPGRTRPTVPLQLFHKNRYIPPLPAGYATTEFLKVAEMLVETLDDQSGRLARIGQWLAQARRQGKRIWAVAAGHSHPQILELPEDNSYPLEWGPAISDLKNAIPADLCDGDVALHFGYGPTSIVDTQKILDRGVKLIHTSPYGPRAGMPEHKNFLWFDLPWRPGDAVVDIPGYGVRILPSSSTAHTIAYNAILCEMAEVMGWK